MVRSAGCADTVNHSKKHRYAQAALRKETPGGADPLADDLGVPKTSTGRLVERVRAGFPFPELEWIRWSGFPGQGNRAKAHGFCIAARKAGNRGLSLRYPHEITFSISEIETL
ncbi:hypothetical protein [uncultured Lamprocystis sp.]|uniref:hypothetical protein n=1 Tax=uncultured Lamprocystis sp. TaxID=543132 RepID=UPI0025D97473|nr:hypothetical protein [uncultured Lamprocystis sp.]